MDAPDDDRPPLLQRLGVRLAALLGLGAAMSALLAMAAMLAIAGFHADQDAQLEAQLVARGAAFSLQAPVSFDDAQGIRDAIALLQARPQIEGAWVHDRTGQLLHATGTALLRPGAEAQGGLARGWLQVTEPVVAGTARDVIGRVTIHYSLEAEQRKLGVQALAAAGASLLAALLALVVSQRLARRISVPVVQLATTASRITQDQNYELRLPPAGRDEVGIAVRAFNHMLAEIKRRGISLMELNQQLQRQAEVARAAQARAESASQAKTRFLANMSHELRSPLNGVIGAAQLLQAEGADPTRRAELVEIIRSSGSNLLGLIEHVLDLARIEAGALELAPQDFNLLDCVESAVMSSAASAAAKGLVLSCHVDPTLRLWRHADDLRLRQLVLNLLGNAIKFTDQGEVSVDVRPVPGADERVRIEVRDTGIGIPGDALDTVFLPFQQADASTTRRYGGSGLGLAICRDLARLMDGEVGVRSRPGAGSVFTIELPLPPARRGGEERPAPLGLPVAWCEPHEPSARALSAILARLGCESRRCEDRAALEAFVAACRTRGESPWFIVALDSEPGRQMLAAALPLLDPGRVLPVDAGADAREAHAREAMGLRRALARPVLRSTLVSRLAVAPRPSAAAPTGPVVPAPGSAPLQVLLVEDDPINQAVVRSMLEHAGFACTVAAQGVAALQHLSQTRFDIVLMDWQMPEMDGLEATRRLRDGRAGNLNRGCPVVALTANAFAEDRSACLAAGMNDFVTKPVLASHLIATVERWASRRPLRLGAPAPARPATAPAAPVPGGADGGAPVYDPQVLARLPMVADGSDPGYAVHLLQLFIRSADQLLADLGRGIATADLQIAQRALHSLKSSAGQVGAMALAAEAAEGEAALRRGQIGVEQLPVLLDRLRQARESFADRVARPPA